MFTAFNMNIHTHTHTHTHHTNIYTYLTFFIFHIVNYSQLSSSWKYKLNVNKMSGQNFPNDYTNFFPLVYGVLLFFFILNSSFIVCYKNKLK